MAKVSIAQADKTDFAPFQGRCRVRPMLTGDKHPLHLVLYDIPSGESMMLSAEDKDLACYVWRGGVRAGLTALDAGSCICLPPRTNLQIAGSDRDSVLAVFSAREPSSHEGRDHRAQLLPSRQVPRSDLVNTESRIGGALFANARVPVEHLWLHENNWQDGREIAVHSHTEDEIIFLISGQIGLGGRLYDAGTALAVAANVKYGFRSGPSGMAFINFRTSSPTYTRADGTRVIDEGAMWSELLGKPEYLAIDSEA